MGALAMSGIWPYESLTAAAVDRLCCALVDHQCELGRWRRGRRTKYFKGESAQATMMGTSEHAESGTMQ